jgi:hypothetical protein
VGRSSAFFLKRLHAINNLSGNVIFLKLGIHRDVKDDDDIVVDVELLGLEIGANRDECNEMRSVERMKNKISEMKPN